MSSRRRMLKRGRWRLMKLCSASSASASVAVTRHVDPVDPRGEPGLAAGEVGGDAFADRARLADVDDLALGVVEEVDARGVGQVAALLRDPLLAREAAAVVAFGHRSKGRLLAVRPNCHARHGERDDDPDPEPARAEHAEDRDRRRDRHPHPRPARRLQRDEPGDDRRADRRLLLARRPGAAAGADRHRRRQGVLRRRRRQLVQDRGRGPRDRPALAGAARRRGAAPGDRRPAADPLPGDRRGQRAGGRRRLLAGARLRHADRLRGGLLRLRLRPDRRLPGRRHDLLPAAGRRPQPGAGDPPQRPQHERRRTRSPSGSSPRWSPPTS